MEQQSLWLYSYDFYNFMFTVWLGGALRALWIVGPVGHPV